MVAKLAAHHNLPIHAPFRLVAASRLFPLGPGTDTIPEQPARAPPR
jgi:hypothetical protein